MPIGPSTRLGPYEIQSALGAGGMGEVYRARDTRLKRDVALKLLPETFAADPERLARFQREAEVLASLNHPHIAQIYGVEETDSTRALVMELVEGEDLSQRIARGPIPIDEALPIAKQIAEALQAAHEHGVIHRDLKPANIKIREDGTVKVLDFGLAKLTQPQGSALHPDVTASPTITSPVMMTGAGVLLGTAAYMSPEQAKGREADKRSDVWAFGCVLYEMLTGKRAFEGEDVTDVLVAVLSKDPDWGALRSEVSSGLRALIRGCLEKDRRKRVADISTATFVLDEHTHLGRSAETVDSNPLGVRHGRLVWATALLIGTTLALATAIAVVFRPTAQGASAIRFAMDPPKGWTFGLSPNLTGGFRVFALSADGRQLAFVARDAAGQALLWVRSLDRLDAQPLKGTEGASSPFWSPDGRFLGFFADGKLKKIDVTGGPAVTLCAAPDNRGGTWNGEDVILFSQGTNAPLQRVSASGGTPKPATELGQGDLGHARPSFLPDGRHYLYVSPGPIGTVRPIYLGSLDSPQRTRLLESTVGDVVFSANHLLFMRDTTLMAQPFNVRDLTVEGEAVPIAENLKGVGNVSVFTASPNGILVFGGGVESVQSQLTWFDRAGKAIAPLGEAAQYWDVELSPDGNRVAVEIDDPTRRTGDIWIYDVVRGIRTRFTFDPGDDVRPLWSPDRAHIAFVSRRGRDGNVYQLFQKPSSGGGSEEKVFESPDTLGLDAWSPDGAILFLNLADASDPSGTGRDLWTVPLSGDRRAKPLLRQPGVQRRAQPSPDGRWLAYESDESGQSEIYVTRYPEADAKWQVSTAGGSYPRWRADGREIFYVASDVRLMVADVTSQGTSLAVGAVHAVMQMHLPRTTGGYPYAVTPDGQKYLVNTLVEDTLSDPLNVVVNWASGLGK
jgi:eukaryotic-like serine/threonine-protein kinase